MSHKIIPLYIATCYVTNVFSVYVTSPLDAAYSSFITSCVRRSRDVRRGSILHACCLSVS